MSALSQSQKIRMVKMMGDYIPHTALLGIEVEKIHGDELTLRLPYQSELVGDPETGTLHGGV